MRLALGIRRQVVIKLMCAPDTLVLSLYTICIPVYTSLQRIVATRRHLVTIPEWTGKSFSWAMLS